MSENLQENIACNEHFSFYDNFWQTICENGSIFHTQFSFRTRAAKAQKFLIAIINFFTKVNKTF